MAATYTYPGVYVEEIPSGVRPIAGVSTSNTAFVDFFERGPVNVARRLDNMGDLQRVYGGLHRASEASYGLQQYFLNGGSTAYAIRVLLDPLAGETDDDGNALTPPAAATIELNEDADPNADTVLTLTATSLGSWGNRIAVGVIHAEPPLDTFSLTVREYAGEVLVASENFDDVNTTPNDPSNVVLAVNGVSALVTVEVDKANARPMSVAAAAQQEVDDLTASRPALQTARDDAQTALDARTAELPQLEVAVAAAIEAFVDAAVAAEQQAVDDATTETADAITGFVVADAAVDAAREGVNDAVGAWDIARDAWAQIDQAHQDVVDDVAGPELQAAIDAAANAAPGLDTELAQNEVRVVRGELIVRAALDQGLPSTQPIEDAAAALRSAVDAAALAIPAALTAAEDDAGVVALREAESDAAAALTAARASAAVMAEADQTVIDARTDVADKLVEIGAAEAVLAWAIVDLESLDPAIRVAQRNADIDELDDIAQGLLTSMTNGSDGVPPGSAVWAARASNAIVGNPLDSSGIFALNQIAPEIFNIMCIPAAAELDDAGASAVFAAALKYCKDRRAFLIVDPPRGFDDPLTIGGWPDLPRDSNSALFFPRLRIGDPLAGNAPRSVASSGTVAGIFARTDADRGVFKAPAGTATSLRGTSLRLTHELTDKQNGVLNVRGINVLRNFPIYNNISWGARTLVGANAMASEWKYIPVRRTALFIEESLFQGLKWVVFEPNDEPLWAQIRLNVGAFMHGLFRQGAFQGTTPARRLPRQVR